MSLLLLSLMFFGGGHPLMMVVIMFFIVFLYCWWMNSMFLTFWFSFILMMVVLSGILVVFSYVVSLVPNEKFEINWVVIVLLTIFGVFEINYNFMVVTFHSMKLWDGIVLFMNLMMVSFLLVVMFMSVWLSEWKEGTVRV